MALKNKHTKLGFFPQESSERKRKGLEARSTKPLPIPMVRCIANLVQHNRHNKICTRYNDWLSTIFAHSLLQYQPKPSRIGWYQVIRGSFAPFRSVWINLANILSQISVSYRYDVWYKSVQEILFVKQVFLKKFPLVCGCWR